MTLSNQNGHNLIDRLADPTYTQLWGIDAHLRRLSELLTDPHGPHIIAIEGVGGIGKTALAHALARHLIKGNIIGRGAYAGCAWISAGHTLQPKVGEAGASNQPSLTGTGLINALVAQLFGDDKRPIGLNPEQLRAMIIHRLAEQPHLIVVDNLEALTEISILCQPDTPVKQNGQIQNGHYTEPSQPVDADTLIGTMRQLINPTRFVLTARPHLFEQPDVHRYPLQELSQGDSLSLIRAEAKHRNRANLANATNHELLPIFQAVGGNPLALRLIASLPDANPPDANPPDAIPSAANPPAADPPAAYPPAADPPAASPLHTMLMDLALAGGNHGSQLDRRPRENLYPSIYQHTWATLDKSEREAWLLLPVVASNGRGMALPELAEIAGQAPHELSVTLERLVDLNLIDRAGDQPNCRYSIHPLARTFLLEHLLKWGEVTG